MWNYEKRLQYPVNIKTPNAKIAQFIMSQYGGPDGEIGASMRYLSQRFTMPNRTAVAVLNDVGTEELAHLEMVSTIVHQLTRGLSMEEIEKSGFGPYYIDHTVGVWPQAAGGVPFNACEFQSKGDPVTDLFEDLAAEQKARATYDNILRVVRDIPEVADPIRFLRAREIVHFQRFGEALRSVQEQLDEKNFYAFNPSLTARAKHPVKIPESENMLMALLQYTRKKFSSPMAGSCFHAYTDNLLNYISIYDFTIICHMCIFV